MNEEPKLTSAANAPLADRPSPADDVLAADPVLALPCWPFPAGSQNNTDKAVKLKPYVPPKRRTLNQY